MAQTLSLRAASRDEAGAAMAGALFGPDTDTTGGLSDLGELLAAAQCFAVLEDARPVAHYAVQMVRHANGREAVIVAAAGGVPGVNLVRSVLPVIEAQAAEAGAAAVAVHTRRRGLVAKLAAQGYAVDGFILRKQL